MQFSKIPGLQQFKHNLLKTIHQGKLPHALMFVGEEGSPNLAMAFALAQYVNCQNPTDTDSCGTCASCRFTEKVAHPDIHLTFPTIGKDVVSAQLLPQFREIVAENLYLNEYDWLKHIDADNKQGNINKKECVEIVKFTGLKTNANYKIVIIWKPENLGNQGNILLKTIEEPPEKTLIIFVASNTKAILGTILSRTQIYQLPLISDNELENFAINQLDIEPNNAKQLSFIANGNVGKLIEIANAKHENTNENILANWLKVCAKNDIAGITNWVEEINKLGREAQKNYLNYVLVFFENAIKIKWNDSLRTKFTERELKMAEYMLDNFQNNDLSKWIEAIEKSIYYIERNAHGKILFMNLSLRLKNFINKQVVIK